MQRVASAVFLCLSATVFPATAQIYVGASSDGSVVLSDFASIATPTKLIAAPRSVVPASVGPGEANVADIVYQVAQEFDVSPHLLHAVIAVESGYNARAVSHKGAQGLMQLMPATAQRFGVTDPFDPQDNVRGGARYLKALLAQFNGDLQLALAAYNAGESAVVRYGNRVPPFAETLKYVPRVLERMQRAVRS